MKRASATHPRWRDTQALLFLVFLAGGCERTPERPLLPRPPSIDNGGRVVALAVDPSNDMHVLAASESGGLFRTRDGGRHWAHVDNLRSFNVTDVEFSPSDPSVIMATAKADWLPYNGGLWRSDDGGESWERVDLSPVYNTGRWSANGLCFEPGSRNFYAACDQGLLKGDLTSGTWTLHDLGASVHSVLAQNGGRLCVGTAYATWASTSGTAGLVRSSSFVHACADAPHAFAASPFDPTHIFFAGTDGLVWKLFLSTDGGMTWPDIERTSGRNRPPNVRISTNDDEHGFIVYFGDGVNLMQASYTDRAGELGRATNWRPTATDHSDPNDIAFGSASPRHLMLATDGGIHFSEPCVFFRLITDDKYLSAEAGGGLEMDIDKDQPLGWESLVITDLNGGALESGDNVRFKVLNGQFVTEAGGSLRADATTAADHETFRLVRRAGAGRISDRDEVQLQCAAGGFIGKDALGNPSMDLPIASEHGTFIIEFGDTWRMDKGSGAPLCALQVSDVAGQVDGRAGSRIFFGTQDNEVWGSADAGATWPNHDCCEGFGIQAAPVHTPLHEGTITFQQTSNYTDRISLDGFETRSSWNRPPGGSCNVPPYLLNPTTHAQSLITTDPLHPFQVHWKTSPEHPWNILADLPHEPVEMPVVIAEESSSVIYQAVNLGWTGDMDRIGVVRLDYEATTHTATVSAPLGTGTLGCIGRLAMAPHYRVALGASYQDPDQLLTADATDWMMKSSSDGGQHWWPEPGLTDLITEHGRFRFSNGGFTLVSAIGFDPYNSGVILIGTTQNGIFKTLDGGTTWDRVGGSDQIPNVSSFYFPPTGPIWVSSYGRGLWQLTLPRAERPGKAPVHRVFEVEPPLIFLPGEKIQPLEEVLTRVNFREADIISVSNGTITDLSLRGRLVDSVTISGGHIHRFDTQGNEFGLVRNTYGSGSGKLSAYPLLNGLAQVRHPIRGLLVRRDTLLGVILSEEELPLKPSRWPRLGTSGSLGPAIVAAMDTVVSVSGSGFIPGTEEERMVTLRVEGRPEVFQAVVDAQGAFRRNLPLRSGPGDLRITAEQHYHGAMIEQGCYLRVVPVDRDR